MSKRSKPQPHVYSIAELDDNPEMSEMARKIVNALRSYSYPEALVIAIKASSALAHALLAGTPPEAREMNRIASVSMFEDVARALKGVDIAKMIQDGEEQKARGGDYNEAFFAPGSKTIN